MDETIFLKDFLEEKRDFSPYLAHLTKDGTDELGNICISAKDVLNSIIEDQTLRATNHFCLFSPSLKNSQNALLEDKFKVVCFTETPIEHIDALLKNLIERDFKPKPYGLIFTKKNILERIRRIKVIQYSM